MRLRITSKEAAAKRAAATEAATYGDLPQLLHLDIKEYKNFYDLNLIVRPLLGDLLVRQELHGYCQEVVEKKGFATPAAVFTGESEVITIYNYEYVPLFEYLEAFDVFRHQAFYTKNKLVVGGLEYIYDMYSTEVFTSQSNFTPSTELFRVLESLSHQWD